MKLTPINELKVGDVFRSRNGRIFEVMRKGSGGCPDCDGDRECFDGSGRCMVAECAFLNSKDNVNFNELPTVRVLEDTARAFRDRLAQEVVSAEVNGGRADRAVYDMLAELETLVGPASVRM